MSPARQPSGTPPRPVFSYGDQEGNIMSKTPVPSTRDRILAYLSDHPSASAADFSQAWGLTRADIRYHLSALLADGLIEIVPRDPNQPAGRGRPQQAVRLAAQVRPNNLPALCHALLAAVLSQPGAAQGDQILPSVASNLAAALAGETTLHTNLTRRLSQLVEILNRAHYRARWEAGAQGPRLLLRACPYAALLAQHPELCQLDQAMLEQLLQTNLRHAVRLDPLTGKPPACIFTLASLG
jgi:predicted ArsR family transcriptional regulator